MADCSNGGRCKFEPHLTPVSSGRKWYRCTVCNAFAWKKRSGFVLYRCAIPKCTKPATSRLSGLGPRASYKWRCDEHGSKPDPAG